MVQSVVHPQEIEVWYILPAIRAELAKAMKELSLDQKKIAELLNITEAAVSQYVSGKRAADVKFDSSYKEKIKEAAKRIVESKSHFVKETQQILSGMWKDKTICSVHHEQNKDLPKNCNMCWE